MSKLSLLFYAQFVQLILNKLIASTVIVSLGFTSLVIGLAYPVLASANSRDVVGFEELLEQAIHFDAEFNEAKQMWQAKQLQVKESRGALLPSLELNISAAHYFDSETGFDTDTNASNAALLPSTIGAYNSKTYGFSARQGLYRPNEWLALGQSHDRLAQDKLRFEQAQTNLIIKLADAFLDLMSIESEIVLVQTQQAAALQQLSETRLRFKVGASGVNETYEAQARLDALSAQLNQLEHSKFIVRKNLTLITGNATFEPALIFSHNTFNSNKLSQDLPLLQEPLENVTALALANSPQHLLQQLEIELAEKNISSYRLVASPTVDAVFNYQSVDSSALQTSYLVNDTSFVEIQLRVPLYQGGRRAVRLEQAHYERRASLQRLEGIRRSVELETAQAYYGIESAIRQKTALERAVRSHKSALKAAERGQELGERSTTDVLNAQQALFSTEHNLRLNQLEMLKNILSLYSTVGSLNLQRGAAIFK